VKPPVNPTPNELLARHAAAVLGQFDTSAHRTRYTRERVEPVPGVTITTERFQRWPSEIVTKVTDPMGGVQYHGFDGKIAWEIGADGKPRLVTGSDAQTERVYAMFYDGLLAAPARGDLATVGEVDFEGEAAFDVSLKEPPASATAVVPSWYFSKSRGVFVGQVLRRTGETGAETMRVLLQDYKSFGGMLVATRRLTRSAGREVVQVIDDIQWDSVPDRNFELPDSVRALIKP